MKTKTSRFIPLIIILVLGLAYSLTLAPGLTWANSGADGGDLITATATNGVPHPTGYPLYLLLAGIFQHLPLGNLAFRTNLLSAICTVLAALIVYYTARRLMGGDKFRDTASLVTSLVFGLAPLVWSQAVITEVYALQSLLLAGVLFQTFSPRKGRWSDVLRGILVGLALGNHLTSLLLIPLLLWEEDGIHLNQISHLLMRLLGLLVGSFIYIVLPIRALSHPPINWGNPVTLISFYKLISAQIYQSYFSLNFVIDRVRGWAGLLMNQFGFPGLVIGLYALLGGKKIIKRILPLLWIFITYGIFSLIYSSFDSYVYLIPTVLAFSFWIGMGIQSLLNISVGRWPRAGWAFGALIILLLIFRAVTAGAMVDASKDDRAELFGRTVMDTVPVNAMVFTQDDPSTFALWYFHFALKQRPDMRVIVEGLLQFDWYGQTLRYTYPDLEVPKDPQLFAGNLTQANPSRPVCFVDYQKVAHISCSP